MRTPLFPLVALSGLGLALAACGDSPVNTAGKLTWYSTCGAPVCQVGINAAASGDLCTTQKEGESCTSDSATCLLDNSCNVHLVCASTDPKGIPEMCPISRKQFKTDIRYLTADDLKRYADQIRVLKLASFRYKKGPSAGTERLGFMIEDAEPSAFVDSNHGMVDLYGYMSSAVAAIQLQAREIDELKREVADLRNGRSCFKKR